MDDGYWEALLRDVENEASTPTAVDSEDELGAPGAMPSFQEWRPRTSAGAPGDEETDWERAQDLLESGDAIDLVVTGYNRGGLLADFGCVQGFSPASHLLAPPAAQEPAARMAALAARVGETLCLRVIEIDRERRRLILSERCAQKGNHADDVLAHLNAGAGVRRHGD